MGPRKMAQEFVDRRFSQARCRICGEPVAELPDAVEVKSGVWICGSEDCLDEMRMDSE